MATVGFKVVDAFDRSYCSVCGYNGVSQYFSITDNFIEYSDIFFSLREILAEALDLHVS